MLRWPLLASAVLASILALFLHAVLRSPISPRPLPLPSSSFPPNDLLQGVEKLGEGVLQGPEDVCFDGDGTLYTVSRDGWVKRMHANGSWENWRLVGGRGLLGITLSATGGVLVCDADKGLLKVGEEGVTILASEVLDGTKIRFADEVIEASNGSAYFSDVTSKFGLYNSFLDVLEAKPHGRLLRYDPPTKSTSVVLDGLSFPNGVALSPDEEFLIVCETWKFRCLKHWLKGELRGETEVFIENLPGGPDNIHLAPDGSFWIALLQMRSRWLDLIHGLTTAKQVLGAFPKLVEMSKPYRTRGTVINVGADGRIRRMLGDPNGKVMSYVTSAVEYEGHLYIGNLGTNFIGKLVLER